MGQAAHGTLHHETFWRGILPRTNTVKLEGCAEEMTNREQYDLYERTPRHRIPRCPNCNLILPCRNDGAYGPCDAREVTTESYDNNCALIRAIFGLNLRQTDRDEAEETRVAKRKARAAAVYAAKIASKGRTYGPGKTHCRRGHAQNETTVYEGLRGNVLRTWCKICQLENYARKNEARRDQTRQNQNKRTVTSAGETESARCTEPSGAVGVSGRSDRAGRTVQGETTAVGG